MAIKKWAIPLIIAIPWLIIVGMVAGAYLPIFTGQKYLLSVEPRDPRDFFRGNYVDLRYSFTSLDRTDLASDLNKDATYRFGDTLYLDLKKVDGKLNPVGLFAARDGVKNIALKVQPQATINGSDSAVSLTAGIESFFAPKKAALDWEKALREHKVSAEVAIDKRGSARLVRLIAE